MVDPKRHLYKLSDEDRKFVEECEEEFKDRFTANDPDFAEYCQRPSRPPPIVDPWMQNNQRRNNYHDGFRHNDEGGGHRGGYNRRYNNHRGYHNNYRGGRGNGRPYHNRDNSYRNNRSSPY